MNGANTLLDFESDIVRVDFAASPHTVNRFRSNTRRGSRAVVVTRVVCHRVGFSLDH